MNTQELKSLVRRTPLLPLKNGISGKAENLQTGRSYKIRGVVQALLDLSPETLAQGVSSVSAGNLGQAVARAAAALGIPCQIYVPDTAPEVKKQKIRQFGAELIEVPFQEIWSRVLSKNPQSAMHFLHPAFEENLRIGYASIATEILEDLPEIDALVIPYGLGGLFLGVAETAKKIKPQIRIYSCEFEGATPLQRALTNSTASVAFQRSRLVDAIGTPEVIPELFARVRPVLNENIVISERETSECLRALYDYGLVAEGAAAVAYAAARRLSFHSPQMKVAAVLSGGNIDPDKIPL